MFRWHFSLVGQEGCLSIQAHEYENPWLYVFHQDSGTMHDKG